MITLTKVPMAADCSVELMRTLRVPDSDGESPLPPGLGPMLAYRASADGDFVVPMHRAEALWLSFDAPFWKPRALKVGIGGVDALSGAPFDPGTLSADPQDYLVIPEQPWLDGINGGDGLVRQFVAVPLGEGLTIEGQLTGSEREGGLTLSLFQPRPGRFPDEPPFEGRTGMAACCAPAMGLGAGGHIRQEIYRDEHGFETWEPEPAATVRLELVDALAFAALTGLPMPHPPADAETYTSHGFPWFDLLSPTRKDIEASERLAQVRSIADLEGRREEPLPISESQVRRLLELREPVAG